MTDKPVTTTIAVAEAIGCIDADRCTRFTARGKPRKGREIPCSDCMEAATRAIKAYEEVK